MRGSREHRACGEGDKTKGRQGARRHGWNLESGVSQPERIACASLLIRGTQGSQVHRGRKQNVVSKARGGVGS